MDPIIGAALVSGGTQTLGGLLGAYAQSQANAANLQAVRETNEMNERLFHEQLAYQTSEREATQAYNDPSKQRQRYESAGFNPYAMLGQFESGNTNMQSAPSSNAMQAALVAPEDAFSNAIRNIGNDVGQSMVYAAQADNINMDSQIKKIDLTYRAAEKIASIKNQLADIESKRSKTAEDYQRIANLKTELDIQKENLDILRSTKSEVKAQQIARTKRAELENEYQDLQNKYQTWFNDYAKKHGNAELRQIASVIAANMASAGAMSVDKVLKELEAKGIKLDNYHKARLNPLLRDAQRLENKKNKYKAKYPSYFDSEVGQPFFNLFGSLRQNISNKFGYEHYKESYPTSNY